MHRFSPSESIWWVKTALPITPSTLTDDRPHIRETRPNRTQRKADLTVKIIDHHRAPAGTYGSPRISADLRAAGERLSDKTVAKIMAEIGLARISPRTFKVRTTMVDPPRPFPLIWCSADLIRAGVMPCGVPTLPT